MHETAWVTEGALSWSHQESVTVRDRLAVRGGLNLRCLFFWHMKVLTVLYMWKTAPNTFQRKTGANTTICFEFQLSSPFFPTCIEPQHCSLSANHRAACLTLYDTRVTQDAFLHCAHLFFFLFTLGFLVFWKRTKPVTYISQMQNLCFY